MPWRTSLSNEGITSLSGMLVRLTGLPILALALLVTYRLADANQTGTLRDLAATPHFWFSLVIFLAYPFNSLKLVGVGRIRAIAVAVFWIIFGLAVMAFVFSVNFFDGKWYGVVVNAILTLIGAASFADGYVYALASIQSTKKRAAALRTPDMSGGPD